MPQWIIKRHGKMKEHMSGAHKSCWRMKNCAPRKNPLGQMFQLNN